VLHFLQVSEALERSLERLGLERRERQEDVREIMRRLQGPGPSATPAGGGR
jgi:hypothetical protein